MITKSSLATLTETEYEIVATLFQPVIEKFNTHDALLWIMPEAYYEKLTSARSTLREEHVPLVDSIIEKLKIPAPRV